MAKKRFALSRTDIILDIRFSLHIIGLKNSRQKKDKKKMNDAP